MKNSPDQKHWEHIYENKNPRELSWTQSKPSTSLDFIAALNLKPQAEILDVGGGDSNLTDHLLREGYRNITVLDISEQALKKAQSRLGPEAAQVNWLVQDIREMDCGQKKFDFWHDRATFHFMTTEASRTQYLNRVLQCLKPGGFLILAAFSKQGPKSCSGLEIKQYSEKSLEDFLQPHFKKLNCLQVDHYTPSGAAQNFLYCSFQLH